MAKTPMYDPGTSEARSSWLAGLAEACSKMSGVLDMATGTFEDLPLPELFISSDDRYRIYQAPPGAKLWLSAVIKKNGVEITEAAAGFSIDYLGGSVAFDADKRLTADDVITASGTYIIGDSDQLQSILSDIDSLSRQAGKYKGYYATIAALTAAQPTASNGDYAIVGETESFHVWSGGKWVDTVKVTDLSDYYTSAEIDDLLDDKQNVIPAHGNTAASDAYYYGGRKTWQNIFSKVLSTALTGFSTSSDTAVAATDTVLTALGKLQAQINSNIHPLKGTGAPTTSTKGVVGQEYINTSNGDVYRCTAIQNGSYTWVQYQDKLQGTQGQIVGFDANGKAIAQAPPDTGVTSFKGRTGAVTPASGDYTAAQVGAVPTARKVNGKALSDDITLSASDVGAVAKEASDSIGLDNVAQTGHNAHSVLVCTQYDKSGSTIMMEAVELCAKNQVANLIGAVPTTRKVNGKALSEDISLTASDVGALSALSGTAGQVIGVNSSGTVKSMNVETVAVTKTHVTVYEGESTSVTVTRSGSGAITATSKATGIATATVSGTTVTIKGVAAGETNIVVSIATDADYLGLIPAQIAVTVKAHGRITDAWSTVSSRSANGTAGLYYSVGDVKAITINGTVGNTTFSDLAIDVFIVGFDHNSSVEGTNRTHFQIGKINGIKVGLVDSKYGSYVSTTGYFSMNSSDTNSGGWNSSQMRTNIMGGGYTPTNPRSNSLMAALPSDLRSAMKSVTKRTDNTGGGGDTASYVTATTEYLCLPAEFEIFGKRSYANSAEQNYQQQYRYYADGNSKIHYKHNDTSAACAAWLRSPLYYSSYTFCIVNSSGGATNTKAYYSWAVAPLLFV